MAAVDPAAPVVALSDTQVGHRFAGLRRAIPAGAAVPVALGLVDAPAVLDWTAVATLAGVGAAVVLGVTALSLPPLWRVMRADGLRTE